MSGLTCVILLQAGILIFEKVIWNLDLASVEKRNKTKHCHPIAYCNIAANDCWNLTDHTEWQGKNTQTGNLCQKHGENKAKVLQINAFLVL